MKARHLIAAAAAVGAAWLTLAPPAAAAGGVQLAAAVNGQQLSSTSADHPIALDPKRAARITLSIKADHAVTVHRVELSGRVVGLSFYSFDTTVNLVVAPGTPASLGYSLDLTGLRGQATGLIGGTLTLYDDRGRQVAQQRMVSDVRGSLWSVYGLFGFALLVLTILALLDTALSIARHRLPANRWRRGLRFMTPGIGLGLVLVFTLSATGVWVPTTGRWLLFGAGFAVAAVLLGYLSPTPVTGDGRDDDDEDDDDDGDDDGAAGAGRWDDERPLTLPGFTPTTLTAVEPAPGTTSTFVPSRWPDPPPPPAPPPPAYVQPPRQQWTDQQRTEQQWTAQQRTEQQPTEQQPTP